MNEFLDSVNQNIKQQEEAERTAADKLAAHQAKQRQMTKETSQRAQEFVKLMKQKGIPPVNIINVYDKEVPEGFRGKRTRRIQVRESLGDGWIVRPYHASEHMDDSNVDGIGITANGEVVALTNSVADGKVESNQAPNILRSRYEGIFGGENGLQFIGSVAARILRQNSK